VIVSKASLYNTNGWDLLMVSLKISLVENFRATTSLNGDAKYRFRGAKQRQSHCFREKNSNNKSANPQRFLIKQSGV